MKVTVALLTCNRARFLGEAIDAALAQTFTDFELLVLDNASTDGTSQLVQRYHDPRMRYVRHPENIGAIANGNAAFALARGTYLLITHDDDRMKPDLLARQVAVLDAHPEILLVSTNAECINEQGRPTGRTFALPADVTYARLDFIRAYARGEMLITCPTVMTRLAFMRSHPDLRFRAEVGPVSDVDLWIRLNAHEGLFHIISEPLFQYRMHPGQDSTINSFSMNMSFYPYFLMLCSRLVDDATASLAARTLKESLLRQLVFLLCTGVLDTEKYRSEMANVLQLPPKEANRLLPSLMAAWIASQIPFVVRTLYRARNAVRRLLAGRSS
jgi:glycosyltransferase involved in cell wall biosynthesis